MSSDNKSDIDRLQPDKGDVKAATGNIHFDEDKKEKKATGEGAAEVAAAPAAQQQQQQNNDHLEPSKEPSKPGSSHPVMDSSK